MRPSDLHYYTTTTPTPTLTTTTTTTTTSTYCTVHYAMHIRV